MVGQWFAHRFLAWGTVRFRHPPGGFALIGLQVCQLQLQLLNLVIELLRLAPKLHSSRRHLNNMFALTPYVCASFDTDMPSARGER